MQQIFNTQDGTLLISDKFDINAPTYSVDFTPYFNNVGSEYTLSFTNLQGVKKITKFTYDTLGSTDNRYLKTYYRISRDEIAWTDWMELKSSVDNFPTIDPKDPLYLDVKWIREGSNGIGVIRLLEYNIQGTVEREVVDGESTINLNPGDSVIIKAPYIYKVFKITDIEIISSTGMTGVEVKYRFSQDNSRTWSNWEPFTKENITTVRINPIRFFQIEYLIINNSNSNVSIQDINLIGDFQNVSKDYFKTNLFGIRECCQSNLLGTYDANGNFIPNTNINGGGSGLIGQSCDTSTSVFSPMTDDQKAQLYNPYAQNTAINLLNKLSTDAQQIFGHKVIYFVTDPDKRGQDHTLNEYQLYNVVCEGEVKVSVEGNNFPDSQIVMNQFDLNLFETMEVHITKQQFKEVFGPQRRPSKEDFLYFCDLNRMYQVDHAQQFRNFNNAAVYYKLILKKYTQKANVQAGNQDIKNTLDKLTRNSTIDELFGLEQTQDKASVANKDQFKPLTKDPIRLEYSAEIDKELIENSSNIISKSNYDLSSVVQGTTAIKYRNLDPVIKVSDNIGYMIWFNIHNYVIDESYNLFNYYDTTNSLGWRVNLLNDNIIVNLNSSTYSFSLTGATISNTIGLDEEVWYCYVLNIDQRNRKLNQWIYKRNTDIEEDAANLPNTILKEIYSNETEITPIEYELENVYGEILASDMKVTNIRLFIDIIPKEEHNKILNQYVIRDDSKYLVFADNANTRLYLPNMPLGNE
jgi:quercetin dioxygenase-like cupin family protein